MDAYLGDVLAVAFSPDGTKAFTGAGSAVNCYDVGTGGLLCRTRAFLSARVHRLRVLDDSARSGLLHVVACGGRCATVMLASSGDQGHALNAVWKLSPAAHLVLDALPLSAPTSDVSGIFVGMSDNSVECWDAATQQIMWRCVSDIRCLLTSMTLQFATDGMPRVLGGTVFATAVVWHATPGGVVESRVAKGIHRGAIHAVYWSSNDGLCFATASEDRSAVLWRKADGEAMYEPVAELRQHGGRVWDVCTVPLMMPALEGVLIATACEDNVLRLWNVHLEHGQSASAPEVVATLRGHTGRGIWCCAATPDGHLLVSGGADGSVKVWNVAAWLALQLQVDHQPVADEILSIAEPKDSRGESCEHTGYEAPPRDSRDEFIRCMCFTDYRTLVAGTNRGAVHLLVLDDVQPCSTGVWYLDIHNAKSAITCVRAGQAQTVLIGDMSGQAALIRLPSAQTDSTVDLLWRWAAHDPHKIGAVFDFSDSLVGTADSIGTMRLWDVHNHHADAAPLLIGELNMTQRVVCASGAVTQNGLVIVVGSQRGDVAAFLFPMPADGSLSSLVSLGFVMRAHATSVVTTLGDLLPIRHDTDELECSSGGSDGYVCTYAVSVEQRRLRRTSRARLAAIAAPEEFVTSDGVSLVAGISSADMVVFNSTDGVHVMRVSCGGWRRPRAILLEDSQHVSIAYFRNGMVHVRRRWLMDCQDAIGDTSANARKNVLSLGPTYHGREIRACVWVVPRGTIPAHLVILVTGSEDGIVREACIDIASNAVTRTAVLAQTMGRSAVRVMCVTQHPDGVGTILVAACSRLVLMCWHITWIEDGTRIRAHVLAQRGLPSTPHSARGGAYADDADDADARYLCVTAWTHGDHSVYVACGSSDAQLSIWALTTTGQNCTWKLVDTAHCSRMQLSVARLQQRSGEMLLAFGSTDGDVTIWACSGADDQEVNPALAVRLRRMATLQRVHQSGVNALRACCGSSAEGSPCTWIITGGDDGAVCVLALVFTPPVGLRVIAAVRCPASHSSSVKCVVLHGGTTFATVSMDQRVCLWRFAWKTQIVSTDTASLDMLWLPSEQPLAAECDIRSFWQAASPALQLTRIKSFITDTCDAESMAYCTASDGAIIVAAAGSGAHVSAEGVRSAASMESCEHHEGALPEAVDEEQLEALFEPYGGVVGYRSMLRAALAKELEPVPLLNGGHKRVNVLQRNRILLRRAARARAEAARPTRTQELQRKPYRFESRHKHAVGRVRNADGRFPKRQGMHVSAEQPARNGDHDASPTDMPDEQGAGCTEPATGIHPAFCA